MYYTFIDIHYMYIIHTLYMFCIQRQCTTKNIIHMHFDEWNTYTVYKIHVHVDCTKYMYIEKKCLPACLLYPVILKMS